MLSVGRRVCSGTLLMGQARRAMSTLGTLYTAPGTPSPDTVHMFLHEAGVADKVAIEKVNINKAANRGASRGAQTEVFACVLLSTRV